MPFKLAQALKFFNSNGIFTLPLQTVGIDSPSRHHIHCLKDII
jgi:hypothetical protein